MPGTLSPPEPLPDALIALARALREVVRAQPPAPEPSSSPTFKSAPQLVAPAPYVRVPLAAAITGYTEKAIRRKIADGIWREGNVWRKAPDGSILISIKGYTAWVEGR